CRNGRGRRRIGGLARRSWNTRLLPSTEIARCCTICAGVHLPGGARCQSASGRPARGPSPRSGIAANVAWSARMPQLVRNNPRRRVRRATLGPLGVVVLGLAAVLVPRPVLRLVPADSTLTVIDYHAHTAASHDGRPGWTARDLARWHAAQGFGASYVTDHNVIFDDDTTGYAIPLLPGVEWSVYGQHVVALGPVTMIDRAKFNRDTPGMLGVFAALHSEGAIGIASLPEYWRNHWDDLDRFVASGVDGFEIVNCAPKALAFPAPARARVLELAREHDLLVVGASDNHGWG